MKRKRPVPRGGFTVPELALIDHTRRPVVATRLYPLGKWRRVPVFKPGSVLDHKATKPVLQRRPTTETYVSFI